MVVLWCVAASSRRRPHAALDGESMYTTNVFVWLIALHSNRDSLSLTANHGGRYQRKLLRNESRRIVYTFAWRTTNECTAMFLVSRTQTLCACASHFDLVGVCVCVSCEWHFCICKWVNVEVRYAIIMRRARSHTTTITITTTTICPIIFLFLFLPFLVRNKRFRVLHASDPSGSRSCGAFKRNMSMVRPTNQSMVVTWVTPLIEKGR